MTDQTAAAPAEAAPDVAGLPERWTLLEALAWIMFRDTRIVRDAAPETPRAATSYWAEVQVPGRVPEIAEVSGEAGYSLMRLSATWASRRIEGPPPPGPETAAAEAELMAKLRAGRLTAEGRRTIGADPREMTPGDWRGLVVREHRRGNLMVEPEHLTGQVWRDVTLARDDVVALWPPLGAASNASSTVVSHIETHETRDLTALAPALPPFTIGAAYGRLTELKSAGQPVMTGKAIRAFIKTEWSGEPTDKEVRRLMRIWPNRSRGPQPRNSPKLPPANIGKPRKT